MCVYTPQCSVGGGWGWFGKPSFSDCLHSFDEPSPNMPTTKKSVCIHVLCLKQIRVA